MVKKKTIGKIQLIIGVILLGGSIMAGFFIYNWYKDTSNQAYYNFEKVMQSVEQEAEWQLYSNSSKALYTLQSFDLTQSYVLETTQTAINVWLALGLVFIISLLFITQGLLNSSNNKKYG